MKSVPVVNSPNKPMVIDDEKFSEVMEHKWSIRNPKLPESPNRHGSPYYPYTWIRKEKGSYKIEIHRFLIPNVPKGMQRDHKNGDIFDNRMCNIRICTPSQNSINRGISKNNTSGYKGVTRNPNKNKPWKATITKDGKTIHIGSFSSKINAAKAYDKKALELFGEFAYLNFSENKAIYLLN